ncbi:MULTISPECIES: phage holin [Clostridiaceae]|uniref:Phage holin n=1 Tax=Clostridium facile TaxID=2763035 RepID=A0ABR7IPY1_9CLOT|nr:MULTISPECIES: phage holin [Clostridiaceae]MBC5786912.1 phage holin [Clostridium facile]
MKINWKVRLQNKTFLIAFIGAILTFVYTILGMFGIVPSITQNMLTDAIMALINILVALGVVTDPTTQGIGDSSQAMSYTIPK